MTKLKCQTALGQVICISGFDICLYVVFSDFDCPYNPYHRTCGIRIVQVRLLYLVGRFHF